MASRSIKGAASGDWDAVWAEYDARCPRPAATVERRRRAAQGPRPPGVRERRGRGWMLALLLAPLLALAGQWLAAPASTAWQVAQAMEARDPAALEPHLDMAAVQEAVRASLAEDLARAPDGRQASAFLAGMAAEMTAAWASPTALAEVAKARGVAPGAAAEALRRAQPQGLTRIALPLGSLATPMTLRLEFTGAALAPRWQVTAVELAGAAPALPPPPMRLSALR